jgi:hypothetical protein
MDVLVMGLVLDDLQFAMLDVWAAPKDLRPGSTDWRNAIEWAIKNARCMVVLLSSEAHDSKWVNEEITCAEENKLKIYPFVIRGDPSNVVPLGLKTSQRFDARNDYTQEINKLITEICRDLSIVDTRILWSKTANFYSLISDIHAAKKTLKSNQEFDLEYVKRCLRQAHHHATELRLIEISERLAVLRQKADEFPRTEWALVQRQDIDRDLFSILSRIDELSRVNQPNFNAGLG